MHTRIQSLAVALAVMEMISQLTVVILVALFLSTVTVSESSLTIRI